MLKVIDIDLIIFLKNVKFFLENVKSYRYNNLTFFPRKLLNSYFKMVPTVSKKTIPGIFAIKSKRINVST